MLQRKKERLRTIEVLLADPDARMARLVRHVLENLGFRQIHWARSGAEAIDLLRHKPIDFVIAEWPLCPTEGVSFVRTVRRMEESAFRDIPIILLTGRAEQRDVERARDDGVTEFVVKPFNAASLAQRLAEMIDHPRPFVIARDFAGPDRRRRPMPDDAHSRRLSEAEKAQYATRFLNRTVYHIHDQEIIIYHPDRSLKQLIGPDLTATELFDEETVRAAQQIIYAMKDEFVAWVQTDIARLEHAYGRLRSDSADVQALKAIHETALTIKAQAGTFDYAFASAIGKSLFDFTEGLSKADALILTTIRKHIDTLYVIFQKEIHGSGPEIGEEVLISLRHLIAKSRKARGLD